MVAAVNAGGDGSICAALYGVYGAAVMRCLVRAGNAVAARHQLQR